MLVLTPVTRGVGRGPVLPDRSRRVPERGAGPGAAGEGEEEREEETLVQELMEMAIMLVIHQEEQVD